MVAPVVAASAAPMVVESATKEDGLINQAFKLTVLIGLGLALAIGLFLIYKLTGLLTSLADIFNGVATFFDVFSTNEVVATTIITAFPFGRGYLAWKRIVG